MPREEILAHLAAPKLKGMRAAYHEIVSAELCPASSVACSGFSPVRFTVASHRPLPRPARAPPGGSVLCGLTWMKSGLAPIGSVVSVPSAATGVESGGNPGEGATLHCPRWHWAAVSGAEAGRRTLAEVSRGAPHRRGARSPRPQRPPRDLR